MGCRLPKLRRTEERSPGKIYSTLRRPQVETKVGVAYTYHFLDFLLGKEEVSVSSVLCLSSVRELPVQVRELYSQGFVLVAVHPFVHPCGPRHARIQRQLHRAVLIRETHSSEKTQLMGRRLETDVCVAGHQTPDPEVIQSYVKKVQDVAEQGVLFVGFLQQPGGGPCFLGHWDPEDLSSLHSSPSPIHRHPPSTTVSPTEPREPDHNLSQHTDLEHNLLEPNTPDHSHLEPREPDPSPLEPIQIQLDNNPNGPTDREQNHSPITSPGDQSNHCLAEPTESTDKPQNHMLVDPTKEPQSQNDNQSHNLTETTCTERHQDLRQAESLGTEPDHSPSTKRYKRADPNLQNQGERQSPSPVRHNQIAGRTNQDATPDYQDESLELEVDEETGIGPETPLLQGGTEREGSHGDRDTVVGPTQDTSDLDEFQSSNRVTTTHNNNNIQVKSSEREKKTTTSPPAQTRVQLFALYNNMGELCSSLRFYSLRVPLRVQTEAGLVTEVDANWLDHMTQHFTSGARLIDGFFHLGDDNDNGVSSVDSVFIFQSSPEETTPTIYDAIVVEQWTIVDGVVVRTDYIPLLQSLAPYGWRLMCVVPTPIVRTNSDGSLSTKQILFLQRPALQRKKKDFKILNLRGRNRAKKNAMEETPEKRDKNMSQVTERGMDGARRDSEEEGEQEASKNGESRNTNTRNVKTDAPQREEDSRSETEPLNDFSLCMEVGATDMNQEEEGELERLPLAKQEKTVICTGIRQKNGCSVTSEEKSEERVTQPLNERALFSGVC